MFNHSPSNDESIERIRAQLEQLKPIKSVIKCVRVGPEYSLVDAEERFVKNALDKRRSEFAAGRYCARTALETAGTTNQAILKAQSGCPIWPDGFVGSISHTDRFATALIAPTVHYAGLGIDIEHNSALKSELHSFVLTPLEKNKLLTQPTVKNTPRCKLSFVIKETIYKAVFPFVRCFFDFQQAVLTINTDGDWAGRLSPSIKNLPESLSTISGRWSSTDELIMAVAEIEQDGDLRSMLNERAMTYE